MFNVMPYSGKRMPIRRDQDALYPLQREMNRLFDEFMGLQGGFFGLSPELPILNRDQLSDIAPRVDVSETDKELLIKVDVPGMTEKDVTITFNRDVLTISGEKQQDKEESARGWYRMERQYGSFSRSIALPFEVDINKADAIYKHGVLTIKLPKSESSQRTEKAIPVKAG